MHLSKPIWWAIASCSIALMQSAIGAEASMPERAPARPYTPPPATPHAMPAVSTEGESSTAPPILEHYLHPAERQAVQTWVWAIRPILSAETVVYTGWNHGHLINVLHFQKDGCGQTFVRQFVVHYERTASGDSIVTVEHYKQENPGSERYAGKTVYVSKQIENKLYLASAESSDQYDANHMRLDVQWTSNGVNASLAQGRYPAALLTLKANTGWLNQRFDLWDQFGLKLN